MSTRSLVHFSRHTLKQLKFVLPGGLLTYYFDSYNALIHLLRGKDDVQDWSRYVCPTIMHTVRSTSGHDLYRFAARISVLAAVVTVSLFLYVLVLPLIQGAQPNYRHWRQSGVLSTVIPIMTTSIVAGWSLLAYTLGRWSSMGYVEGVIAASGLYALSFGLLGLIPAPKVRRQ
ncbi:hypothetical protein C8Q78DRAFT_803309 [Trametes maxima]|nr:hypothetical protein C8Q78DRAFT_803309 [Trametes maxima]